MRSELVLGFLSPKPTPYMGVHRTKPPPAPFRVKLLRGQVSLFFFTKTSFLVKTVALGPGLTTSQEEGNLFGSVTQKEPDEDRLGAARPPGLTTF